jgi:copper(I)-binding protein
MMQKGKIFISAKPFTTDNPTDIEKQAGVKTITLNEAVGFPSPNKTDTKGRYVRVVNMGDDEYALGELEIY